MAGTVTWSLLRELAGFRAEKGCAISLYLNLDPSDVPTAGDAQTRMNSMLHAADRTDRTDLTHEQRMGLKADFERIAQWFDDDFERDGSQGLAVFAAGLDNSWRTLALPAPVDDRAKVGRDFFLAPLAPLIGRADGTIVAVVSREEGQLYRLRGGRLEEIAEHYDETPGQHDQGGWSQARYQRHIEKLVHEHLKGVAEELDRTRRQLQRTQDRPRLLGRHADRVPGCTLRRGANVARRLDAGAVARKPGRVARSRQAGPRRSGGEERVGGDRALA